MPVQDQRAQFERRVQLYLENIQRGGTPPFVSDPAYEEARRRSMGFNPAQQLFQILLGIGKNRGSGGYGGMIP